MMLRETRVLVKGRVEPRCFQVGPGASTVYALTIFNAFGSGAGSLGQRVGAESRQKANCSNQSEPMGRQDSARVRRR